MLGAIQNPQIADIAGALDIRQKKLAADEARRKEIRTAELIKQAIPGLREGSPLRGLAGTDIQKFAFLAKAMGVPLNSGEQMQEQADDAHAIAQIAESDPEGALQYVNTLRQKRSELGLDTSRLDSLIGIAKQDPGKAIRAVQALDKSLNADLYRKREMENREMSQKDRALDIQEKRMMSGADDPSGLREFYGMTKGMSEQDREKARRIALGLDPRAMGSAAITTATQGLTDVVAGSESAIKDATKRAEQEAKNATDTSKKYFDQLSNINANINNYKEGVRLLREEGASTGVVEKRLPSLKAASQKLDNLRNRLGLDVVSGTTFGALSEAELAMALDTGMPSSLKPLELAKWFEDRMAAQQKLADILDGAIQFLAVPGNSLADLRQEQKNASKGGSGDGAMTTGITQSTTEPSIDDLLSKY